MEDKDDWDDDDDDMLLIWTVGPINWPTDTKSSNWKGGWVRKSLKIEGDHEKDGKLNEQPYHLGHSLI